MVTDGHTNRKPPPIYLTAAIGTPASWGSDEGHPGEKSGLSISSWDYNDIMAGILIVGFIVGHIF